MEYLLIAATCFLGGFLGAYLGKRIDKDTPVPVETAIRKIKKKFTPSGDSLSKQELYNDWLYHKPKGVE